MRKLLFLFTMLALFVACSDDDDKDNELPIKGVEIPKFEDPVKPGESITIKGEGFTKASEIWFRTIVTRAENTGDVKAVVTEVNSTGITFTAPEVYGNQSVLLKENGKEYELGKMTFEEQSGESGDVEILPKKITKLIVSEDDGSYDEIYDFTYDADGKITSIKETSGNDVTTSTFTYAQDKITIEVRESPCAYDADVTMELKDGRLSVYTRDENQKGDLSTNRYEYTYTSDGYLSKVTGVETDNEDGEKIEDKIEETFSFEQGKLMTYNYESDGYSESEEYTYGSQLNNLNIDLFTCIVWNWQTWSADEGIVLGVLGKRSQYLPSTVKHHNSDDGDWGESLFEYKMKDGYISEITITWKYENGDEDEVDKIQIFYED